MSIALYRKYRSKTLDDIVGQESIVSNLKSALKAGKVSHAYLFTGPHGVGKTSIARILAHEITGLEYDEEQNHVDIIEIDAASNRKIDEIRDLREKAQIAPTSASHKIYIVDEVHMLTKEAFNALLKTLEEPPEHVIFMLATTDFHKLPETIVSRTQHYALKQIDEAKVAEHLATIAKKEKIAYEEDALKLLAEHSKGSFRDAISLLDQLSSLDSLSVEHIEKALGLARENQISELITSTMLGDHVSAHKHLTELRYNGVQSPVIARQMVAALNQRSIETGDRAYLELSEELLDVASAIMSDELLTIRVVGFALARNGGPTPPPASPPVIESPPEEDEPTDPAPAEKPDDTPKEKSKAKPTPKQATNTDNAWSEILRAIKAKHNALYAVLRIAEPRVEGNAITLAFKFPFHLKRAQQAGNLKLIVDTAAEVAPTYTDFKMIVDSSIEVDNPEMNEGLKMNTEAPSSDTESVMDIMGGGEVVGIEE